MRREVRHPSAWHHQDCTVGLDCNRWTRQIKKWEVRGCGRCKNEAELLWQKLCGASMGGCEPEAVLRNSVPQKDPFLSSACLLPLWELHVNPVVPLVQGCALREHPGGHCCWVEQQLLISTRLQSAQCQRLCLKFQMIPEKVWAKHIHLRVISGLLCFDPSVNIEF